MAEILLHASEIPDDLLEYFEPVRVGVMKSVLNISTESFPGAHFATYPRRLVEPCIKAGTSERGVCPRCGAGWVREVETSYEKPRGESVIGSAKGLDTSNGWSGYPVLNKRSSTLAWHPSCQCPPHEPVPAIVLDPFAGSGTTIVVANALGRHGVGLDLSREYLTNQAQRRIERPHAAHIRPARVEPDLPLFREED